MFLPGTLRDGHLALAHGRLRVPRRAPGDVPAPGPRIRGLAPRDRPPERGLPAPAQHLREPPTRQQEATSSRPPATATARACHRHTLDDGGRALRRRLGKARASIATAFAFARWAPSAARADDDATGVDGPVKTRARVPASNVHLAARAFSAPATSPRTPSGVARLPPFLDASRPISGA